MKIGFIGSRKVTILGALLLATLVTGCYDGGGGWGGGGPGWWGGGSPGYYGSGYYGNGYYEKNVYRGYGGDWRPRMWGGGLFAHGAWGAGRRRRWRRTCRRRRWTQ